MHIGERIKNLRNKRNLTQEQLGKYLNVGKSTISQYENNINTPDITTLIKIANYFNTSVEYLLGNTDDPRPLKEIIKNPGSPLDKLLKEYNIDFYNLKEFNEEDMKDIIKYIQFVASKKKNND